MTTVLGIAKEKEAQSASFRAYANQNMSLGVVIPQTPTFLGKHT